MKTHSGASDFCDREVLPSANPTCVEREYAHVEIDRTTKVGCPGEVFEATFAGHLLSF